ncbi:hypothetical protein Syun_014712 [Stephania yunnanensis]|uniref:Uncharacterized protein n=1 Tax=Stephania yunnanensis TaxID=152371 RepID=A0AAP0P923_9MAGN
MVPCKRNVSGVRVALKDDRGEVEVVVGWIRGGGGVGKAGISGIWDGVSCGATDASSSVSKSCLGLHLCLGTNFSSQVKHSPFARELLEELDELLLLKELAILVQCGQKTHEMVLNRKHEKLGATLKEEEVPTYKQQFQFLQEF